MHLVGIVENMARFVEIDEHADILNLRKHPFLSVSQIVHTKKIVLVPLQDVMDILTAFPTEEVDVVWCFRIARSGSTLWCQMFYALPNWIVYSEPTALLCSVVRAHNILNVAEFTKTEEFETMVITTIKMHILMAPKHHSIFWKSSGGLDEYMIPVIKKHFPSHRLLFSYRDCLPSAMSYYNSFGHEPWLLHMMHHTNSETSGRPDWTFLSDTARFGWLILTNGFNLKFLKTLVGKCRPKPNGFEWSILLWASRVAMIREYLASGINIKTLRYDDLRRDPVDTVCDLFSHLGISLDLISLALEAMKIDSQASASCSHKKRVSNKCWVRTSESDQRCNSMLETFNFPDLDSEFQL
mgnify:CR=1 FL=1